MKKSNLFSVTIAVFLVFLIGFCGSSSVFADEVMQVIAVYGDIVSEDGAAPGWIVFNRDEGTIIDICDDQESIPEGAHIIRHDGYIFPGLIDTHNHTHWNSIPMWRTGEVYENRYEWQASDEYNNGPKAKYQSISTIPGLWYDSLTYAEIRAMMGGVTMLQGSDGAEFDYLVRNCNDNWGVLSYVPDVTQADPAMIAEIKFYMDLGYVGRLFLHVAEGKSDDSRTQAEFQFLVDNGLTIPGVVIIHGVSLTPEDFEIMATNGMYFVWSPKTNLVLYEETADVLAALNAGVTVALGADWSLTGSDNLLEELKVAYRYSVEHLGGAITPKMLYKMVTTEAAKVAWADDPYWELLGYLEEGYQADLFLAPRFNDNPHVSLLKTYSRDIQLVVIDGTPVYGDRHYMDDLVTPDELDVITVSHKKKAIDMIDPSFGTYHLEHFDEMVSHFDPLYWDIATFVEDDPGQKPGYPKNLP